MEKEADVVVVGGGIMGCAVAYYLAKRKVKVLLLEKKELGCGATGTSGAFIRLLRRDPVEIPLAIASVEMWENLSAELKYDVGYIPGGCLFTAETEAELEILESYMERDSEAGVDCRMVSFAEIKKLMPPVEQQQAGGLYCPKGGHAEPMAVVKGFADAAKRLGAQIYTKIACWGIEVSGGRVSGVVTNKGKIRTKTVVNVAGAYSGRVARMAGFHMPIKVESMSVAETEPLPPLFRVAWRRFDSGARQTIRGGLAFPSAGARTDHVLSLADFQDIHIWLPRYLSLRKDISLHFNVGQLWREFQRVFATSWEARRRAEFTTFEFKPYTEMAEGGLQALLKLMPSLEGTKIARMWSGPIVVTPDMLPIIGELGSPKGFITAAGFCGHGFALGPIIGRLISELVVDGKASLPIEALRPSRFAEGKLAGEFKKL